MYVHIYVCVCMCFYVCMNTCMSVCMYGYMHLCTYVMHEYMYICMYALIYMYVYIHVDYYVDRNVFVYMYVHMYACISKGYLLKLFCPHLCQTTLNLYLHCTSIQHGHNSLMPPPISISKKSQLPTSKCHPYTPPFNSLLILASTLTPKVLMPIPLIPIQFSNPN